MFKLIEPEKSSFYPPSAPCLMLLCTRKGLGRARDQSPHSPGEIFTATLFVICIRDSIAIALRFEPLKRM